MVAMFTCHFKLPVCIVPVGLFMFQMLLQFEKELAQAVEALTKEQEKAAQAEREKQTQVIKPFGNKSLE